MNAETQSDTETGSGARPQRRAEELEREGDELRADIDRTLEALGQRLAPGEIMDRSIQMIRENGSEWAREIGQTVRQHPVPVLIAGASVVWLAATLLGSDARRRGERTSAGRDQDNGDGNFAQRDHTRRQSSAAHRDSRLSAAASRVRTQAREAKGHFTTLVREQPLGLGALALAAGAIVGAALPVTEYERRTVGPMRDRALAKADELGRRQYEKVRDRLSTQTESLSQRDDSASSQREPSNGGGRAANIERDRFTQE